MDDVNIPGSGNGSTKYNYERNVQVLANPHFNWLQKETERAPTTILNQSPNESSPWISSTNDLRISDINARDDSNTFLDYSDDYQRFYSLLFQNPASPSFSLESETTDDDNPTTKNYDSQFYPLQTQILDPQSNPLSTNHAFTHNTFNQSQLLAATQDLIAAEPLTFPLELEATASGMIPTAPSTTLQAPQNQSHSQIASAEPDPKVKTPKPRQRKSQRFKFHVESFDQHPQSQRPLSALTQNSKPTTYSSSGSSTTTAKSPQPLNFFFQNAYSSSKFDILKLLVEIPKRKNPKFALGVIDLSCAFLVTDPSLPDNQIVYVSESFEMLTKYSEKEIIGKNCRFLQAPGGMVQPKSHRAHCDNETVKHMKQCLDAEEECQVVILNFTKPGVPFLNLVTMIPVRVPDDDEPPSSNPDGKGHLYFIGLQCDIGPRLFSKLTQRPHDLSSVPMITPGSSIHQMLTSKSNFVSVISASETTEESYEEDDEEEAFREKAAKKRGTGEKQAPRQKRQKMDRRFDGTGESSSSSGKESNYETETSETGDDDQRTVLALGSQLDVMTRRNPQREVEGDDKNSKATEVGEGDDDQNNEGEELEEQAVSTVEAEFEKLHERVPNPGDPVEFVSQLSMEGVFLYVSPAYSILLEISPEKMLGQSFYNFLHPDDLQRAAQIHERVKEESKGEKHPSSGGGERVILNFRNGKGKFIPIVTRLALFLNPVTRQNQLALFGAKFNYRI